jgi:hypothetical protein
MNPFGNFLVISRASALTVFYLSAHYSLSPTLLYLSSSVGLYKSTIFPFATLPIAEEATILLKHCFH